MKTHAHRLAALAGALSLAVGACATQPAQLAQLPGTEGCFWTRLVYDWVALDDSTLLVSVPNDRSPYLVKLLGPVPGLAAREPLIFSTGRDGSELFCSRNHPFIIAPGRNRWRQPVVAVRRLTPAMAQQLTLHVELPLVHHAPTVYPKESRTAPVPSDPGTG
jgi:hypothetical protein